MQFRCEEAENDESDLKGFDIVYLAGLVGTTTKEKESILCGVVRRMSVGSLLVVRTAHSLRTLLYPVYMISHPILLLYPFFPSVCN